MRPRKQSHARQAQTTTGPAQPIRRGKRKFAKTAASKAGMQNKRGEQQKEQPSDDMRPHALALKSTALRKKSLARSPDAESKPEPHQEHQSKQHPKKGFKYIFGVHTECSPSHVA